MSDARHFKRMQHITCNHLLHRVTDTNSITVHTGCANINVESRHFKRMQHTTCDHLLRRVADTDALTFTVHTGFANINVKYKTLQTQTCNTVHKAQPIPSIAEPKNSESMRTLSHMDKWQSTILYHSCLALQCSNLSVWMPPMQLSWSALSFETYMHAKTSC